MANKLMHLPDLSIDKVLAIVLKIIPAYDRKKAPAVTVIDVSNDKPTSEETPGVNEEISNDKTDKPSKTKNNPGGEIPGDEILDSDDDSTDYSKNQSTPTPTDVTSPPDEAPIARKTPKPTIFPSCQVILRFMWSAAYQLKFTDVKPKLQAVSLTLTQDSAHIAWGMERHTRNVIGQQPSPKSTSTRHSRSQHPSSESELDHLARTSTTALVGLNNTVQQFLQEQQVVGGGLVERHGGCERKEEVGFFQKSSCSHTLFVTNECKWKL
jgi:hypothetical protein